jgi:hypothetical protein
MPIQSANPSEQLDVWLLHNGSPYTATVGPVLRNTKWRGGQWVRYIDPGPWLFQVEASDGVSACGFILRESENYIPGQGGSYTNWTNYQPGTSIPVQVASGAGAVALMTGGCQALFKYFETVSLDPAGIRQGPPAVYTLNFPLKVSENGLLCQDPDARLLLATGGTEVVVVGLCSAVPSPGTYGRLGADIKY